MTPAPAGESLNAWIARLFAQPEMLSMGHNQTAPDLNLGLGWLYYALARVVRPRRAVVIGSYRGFVPLVLGRAFHDSGAQGEVTFLDPSLVDDFWKDPSAVRAHFQRFGVECVRHFLKTTQDFVTSEEYRTLGEIGILFVDGYHSEQQARFDYRAFESRLAPHGLALFHDSISTRRTTIYGEERAYEMHVKDFVDSLRSDPGTEVLDLPYATGLSLVRKRGCEPLDLLVEGRAGR